MKKHSQELPFLLELQADQQDIATIREQRQLVNKIQSTIVKKDQEIQSLKALLEKYQGYQRKYSSLKLQLSEKGQTISRKESECRLLRKQLQEMIKEGEQSSVRAKNWQSQKQQLIRQRHALEKSSKQAQRAFCEYQTECRRRQQQLLQDLERAYQTNKEQMSKIDELQLELEGTDSLKQYISQLERQLKQKREEVQQQTPTHQPNFNGNECFSSELVKLQQELLRKDEQLSKQQMLNYELTFQYDQAVSSLCSLQSELSRYRKENVELRQTLSSLKEQHQTAVLQKRFSRVKDGRVLSKRDSPPEALEEQDPEQTYSMEEERASRQIEATS